MDKQTLHNTVQELAPPITARAVETEAARELPADLLRELVAAVCNPTCRVVL
jgi:hypothetical protein